MPPAKLAAAWPHVSGWIAEALARGNADLGPSQVAEHLARGTMQLWLVWDGRPVGVCITELIGSVRGQACNLVVVAGEGYRAWAHLLADIERWARGQGCVRLTLVGRKGWVRRLAGDGWCETSTMLEKDLGQQ